MFSIGESCDFSEGPNRSKLRCELFVFTKLQFIYPRGIHIIRSTARSEEQDEIIEIHFGTKEINAFRRAARSHEKLEFI